MSRDSPVLRSASALYGSTVVTAGLGFAFWAVAARLTSPAEVGSAGAAISAMQLVGSFCTFGLGSLLIAELARSVGDAHRMVSAALALSAGAGFLLAYAGALVAGGLLGVGGPLFTQPAGQLLFALGVAAQAATSVLDLALVGARLPGRQLLRNAVFAVGKLALLPACAAVTGLSATWIYAAWLAGALLSVGAVLARSSRPGRWLRPPAPPTALRGLGGQAAGHHVINVSAHAPSLVLPMVVATVLHPVDNAGFYLALQIASFAWAVSVHLSTALFAVSAHDHSRLRRELLVAVRVVLLVTAAGVGGSLLLGSWALGILGPAYVPAAPALTLLVAAALPSAVKALYIALCRVQGRLRPAATAVAAGSALEIALGAAGSPWGVTGVAAGFLLATLLQAAAMWPRVARAAGYRRWPARPGPAASPAGGAPAPACEAAPVPGPRPPADDPAPSVSVVVPTVGRATLRSAVDSALAQTRPPREVLVVFDGSAGADPEDWRDAWPGCSVRLLVGDGGGPTATRTTGVRAATGDLIGFLDDDDEWLPDKLARQLDRYTDLRRDVPYPVIITQCVDVDAGGRVLFVPPPGEPAPTLGDRLFRRTAVRQRSAVGGSSGILAPRALLLAEPLDPARELHEDWEWLLRADRRADARVSVVERPLVRYRLNRPGTSAGSPGSGWWDSVAFARGADLSPRALGDFLLTVSAPIAAARGVRRDAYRIAAAALREGRPGFPAISMFMLLMVTPSRLRWAAAALLQRVSARRA